MILKDIITTCDVSSDSTVADYAINLEYVGNNPCYDVTVQNGMYVVRAATLTGFTFDNRQLLYDGKPHSLTINYDTEQWSGITISYNIQNLVDPGEYEINAQIVKENYETLILSAILTIKSIAISTTNRVNDGQIILPTEATDGFDPDTVLRIEKNNDANINNPYVSLLSSTDTELEEIFGVYDFYAFCNETKQEIPSDIYYLRFKVDGINSSTGIKILALDSENKPNQLEYTFNDGYFTIEVNNFEQIAIVHTTSKMVRDTKSLIMAIVLGVILLWAMTTVLFKGIKKGKKEQKRSAKRHSRWA